MRATPPSATPYGLTERELEVLALVATGRTNRQIGAALFISEKTASVHVSRILAKLDVSSRAQAAAVATQVGLAGGAPAPPEPAERAGGRPTRTCDHLAPSSAHAQLGPPSSPPLGRARRRRSPRRDDSGGRRPTASGRLGPRAARRALRAAAFLAARPSPAPASSADLRLARATPPGRLASVARRPLPALRLASSAAIRSTTLPSDSSSGSSSAVTSSPLDLRSIRPRSSSV